MVFRNPEYWLFMVLHIVLVVLIKETDVLQLDLEASNFDWNAIGATQFFMTFFMTFYSGDCFRRFERMYNASMDILDTVQVFTAEVVVLLSGNDLHHHRCTAVKYMLAAMYVFFMGLTGGHVSKAEWREITRKGLLTKHEIDILLGYPAAGHIESILILTNWAMKAVENGMGKAAAEKSLHLPGHQYELLNDEALGLLRACRKITETLGLPVPYQYFHIMNWVLLTNLFVFSVAAAFFKSYLTIIPVGASLYFFIGIRQISIAVADPFGTEEHDFPVNQFLENTFNTAICILEAFHVPAASDCEYLLEKNEVFTVANIRHPLDGGNFYRTGYDPQNSSPFAWSKEVPFQVVNGLLVSPVQLLHHVIRAHDNPDMDSEGDSEFSEGEDVDAEKETTRQMFATLRKVNAHLAEKKIKEAAAEKAKEEEDKKPKKTQRKLEHLRKELNRARRENAAYEEEVLTLRGSLDVLRDKVAQVDMVRMQNRRAASKTNLELPQEMEGNEFAFNTFGEVRGLISQLRDRNNQDKDISSFGLALPLRPIAESPLDPGDNRGSAGRRGSSAETSPTTVGGGRRGSMDERMSVSVASPGGGGRRGSLDIMFAPGDRPGRRGSLDAMFAPGDLPRRRASMEVAETGGASPTSPLPQGRSRRGSMASAENFDV
eukprot:CAMPEP_0178395436 /NCGR_PEP_ID=MMETSP0689_2-20121128/13218_1 /TAXON_ID=160604 /ORGANISM="Amphidinium massartii, Strain CS-259" /LENGTH=658 /DNA_ID=CAMNT_0020016091 /DNA_START=71 /DNA_END=2047 /DNA_ORIENTATION=+